MSVEKSEEALGIVVEFTKRCLLVHREVPVDDFVAQAFWSDYCHNLGWLVEDSYAGNKQALEWYLQCEPNSHPQIQVGKDGVKEKHILRAKANIEKAVTRVFRGTTLKDYLALVETRLGGG